MIVTVIYKILSCSLQRKSEVKNFKIKILSAELMEIHKRDIKYNIA